MLFSILAVSFSARSAPLQLLSARDPSIPLPAAANGASVSPWISPDGRFVVFSSSASDLVTNDNGYLGLDVFLRDRASNTTVLVSRNLSGTGGGNGHSYSGMASSDGRYVVFESTASDLVPGDTNDASDIFVRDVWTGTTTLVSVSTNGVPGNGASTDAMITPDGHYVAFVSWANDLVTNLLNFRFNIYVRDLVTGTVTLVNYGAIGDLLAPPSPPIITRDGRYVAFSISPFSLGEVYVRDLAANQNIWASTNALDVITNVLNQNVSYAVSSQPSISDDGRYTAFKAKGVNSWNGPAFITVVLRFDSITGTTSLISTNAFLPVNTQNDDVYGPEISPDGRFTTYAATFGNTNTIVVQQWDANTGSNILVSVDVNGNVPTNSVSHSAKANLDGRFVTFMSNATNLATNVVSSGFHVYLRDVQSSVTKLLDANTNSVGATDDWGTVPCLSSNGQFVAFCSLDGSLVGGDNNNTFDVFVRDTVAGTTEWISPRNLSAVAQTENASSFGGPFSISADGRRVAFASFASDLVTNDFNNEMDLFVRDLQTGSDILVSVGSDGNAALGGNSITPAISADGRYVVFASLATNLVANDTNGAADIFLRDLQTGTTTLVNVNTNGTSLGTGDASAPVISADVRYVAFLCYTNITATSPTVFWRDLLAGTTVKLTATSGFLSPSISADGQRVAFLNNQTYLYVWDASLTANIYSNLTAMSSAAISPDGTRVAYLVSQTFPSQLFVRNLAAPTNQFIASAASPIRSSAQWSGDGRYFTFVTTSNLIAADRNFTNDVYLYNLATATLTLISANLATTRSANGPSDWPVMSGEGRFVVFRSWATDIVPGVTNVPALYAFDRLNGTTSLLTAATPGSGWTSWVLQPAVSSNGMTTTFVSWDSGLATSDLNRVSDVFSQTLPHRRPLRIAMATAFRTGG